jgi:hypothetical protein
MAILPLIELGSLWIGDVPVSPTRADFVDQDGDAVAINQFAGWEAYMLSPAGEVLGALSGSEHGNHLEFTWPTESILETEGVHTIIVTFTDEGGVSVQCEPYKFIVQELNGWLTLELARAQWADAPLDDVLLHQILQTAKEQCLDYAPALGEALLPPLAYVQAQLMQARAIYQSVIANQNDNVGIEGFAVRVFPLDFTIRAMLRPKRAIGSVY